MDRPSRCVAIAPWTMIWGVTAPNPHAFRDMANSPAPPSRGCTVRAQGLKSWGVKENST